MRFGGPDQRSGNIEDRRGFRGGGPGMRLGLGGVVILVILSLIFKRDFLSLAAGGGGAAPGADQEAPVTDAAEEPMVIFVGKVLDDAQAQWAKILPQLGTEYHDAKLVLFRDAVQSACGYAETASGPFYCPGDEKVFIDLGFYQELKDRFGAPGDAAQAYVLAHEIGHHVQKLLGTEEKVRQMQQQRPDLQNDLSVRMELQADCYAGVWAANAKDPEGRPVMEQGDFEEGMRAAEAIGDDTLQRQSQGTVVPDSFTHGSSAQRMEALRRGMTTGDPAKCNYAR
jgi:predicted metalloprotease